MQSVFETITGAAAATAFPVSSEDLRQGVLARLQRRRGLCRVSTPFRPAMCSQACLRSPVHPGARRAGRALCVGIDSYPTAPLAGCVRDARAWAAVLKELRFDVTTLLDTEATRQRVLEALGNLVGSAQAGRADRVPVLRPRHPSARISTATRVDRYDEALVPIDYQSGALLLDDDLADIYRQLPAGAVLTLFMDCCHSGTNSRFAPIDRSDSSRPMSAAASWSSRPNWKQAHREFRARAGSPPPTTAEESLPGRDSLCSLPGQSVRLRVEWPGSLHAHRDCGSGCRSGRGVTNESFGNDVAAKVIGLGRPQTPRLMRLPADLVESCAAGRRSSVGEEARARSQRPAAGDDQAMAEWCLQFFESGAAYWRQRLGR